MFRADDAGTWVWHCHILTHVEREEGMFGMVTAIVVQPNPDFDPDINPVKPSNWRHADDHGTTDVDQHNEGDDVAPLAVVVEPEEHSHVDS
jgi:hypothetical protein